MATDMELAIRQPNANQSKEEWHNDAQREA